MNKKLFCILGIFIIAHSGAQTKVKPVPYEPVTPPVPVAYSNAFQAAFGSDGNDGGSYTSVYSSDMKVIPNGLILGGLSDSSANRIKSEGSKGSEDYWVIKTDLQGTKIWDKVYGGAGSDILSQIFPTSDGGFLLVGYSNSGISGDKTTAGFGALDVWIVKIDASGNFLWDKSYGGSGPESSAKNVFEISGKYYIGISSNSGISGNKTLASFGAVDYVIIALDAANGNIAMQKAYGGSGNDDLHSIHVNNDGSFVLFGASASGISGNKTASFLGGPWDYWVVSCNAAGAVLWQKSFGGTGDDFLTDARITKRTNGTFAFAIGGRSDSGISAAGSKSENTHGLADIWLIMIDTNGNKIWDHVYGGTQSDDLLTIDLYTHDTQNTLIPGYTSELILSGFSNSDAFVSANGYKTDNNMGPSDGWVVLIDPTDGQQTKDYALGGNGDDAVQTTKAITTNDATGDIQYISLSFTETDINGTKTVPAYGAYDMWLYALDKKKAAPRKNQAAQQNASVRISPTLVQRGSPIALFLDQEILSNKEAVYNAAVYNVNGQQVFAKQLESAEYNSITIPSIPAGIYLVQVTDQDNTQICQQKIVVK